MHMVCVLVCVLVFVVRHNTFSLLAGDHPVPSIDVSLIILQSKDNTHTQMIKARCNQGCPVTSQNVHCPEQKSQHSYIYWDCPRKVLGWP